MSTESRPKLSAEFKHEARTFAYGLVLRYWAKVLATLAILVVALGAVAAGLYVRNYLRTRQAPPPTVATGLVRIDVNPSRAVVRIDGQVQDVRQELKLAVGPHTASAFLEGYDPAETKFDVKAEGNPPIELRLNPKTLSVRLLVRLSGADVLFDGQKVEPSGDDWFVVPSVTEGAHSIEVRYPAAPVSAKVNFTASPGGVSSIQGPIETKGALVLAVSYAPGASTRFLTSAGPASVNVAEKDLGPITPTQPADADLPPGDWPVTLQEGGRKDPPYPLTIGAGPFLALFLRADLGQVSVDIQPPDATVRLERQGREIKGFRRRRWAFPNLEPGEYLIRAQKDGFDSQDKRVNLAKGAHAVERIVLIEKPKKSGFEITGIPADLRGTVLLDNKPIGSLAPGFRFADVDPGQRAVKLSIRNYDTDPVSQAFAAGANVQLAFADFRPRKRYGKLNLRGVEPGAAVTVILVDEKSGRREMKRLAELSPREMPLEFDVEYTARFEAPGFRPATRKVSVKDTPQESEFHLGRFTLEELPKQPTPTPPPRRAETLPGWDNPNIWALGPEGWKQYKGGSSVQIEAPAGTIIFEIKFQGTAKWQVNYVDGDNQVSVELKKDRLIRRRTKDDKKEREKSVNLFGAVQEFRRVRITLRGDVIEHAIFDNGKWTPVDELDGNTLGKGRFVLSLNNRTFIRNFEYMRAAP
jgi:hypothetical protein